MLLNPRLSLELLGSDDGGIVVASASAEVGDFDIGIGECSAEQLLDFTGFHWHVGTSCIRLEHSRDLQVSQGELVGAHVVWHPRFERFPQVFQRDGCNALNGQIRISGGSYPDSGDIARFCGFEEFVGVLGAAGDDVACLIFTKKNAIRVNVRGRRCDDGAASAE